MRNGFGLTPQVRFRRSRFDMSHGVKTSMNVGTLYPISVKEVIPGDSWKSNVTNVTRVTSAFLKAPIDNLFMDLYHFFVPFRLVYDDSEKVFGNPNPSAYEDNELESFPTNDMAVTVSPGSVADYLGLPINQTFGIGQLNMLPFRAFALIYNTWFRNQNTVDETYIYKTKSTQYEALNNNDWAPNNYTGKLPKVMKHKDYFTSCLPSPQKGAPVNIPITGLASVLPNFQVDNIPDPSSVSAMRWKIVGTSNQLGQFNNIYLNSTGISQGASTSAVPGTYVGNVVPYNLVANLESAQQSVNDMRYAFALQKMLETDALYGSRYNEFLLGHFGVSSPDSRLQLPEFLGGGRIPLHIQQVTQTSQGTEDSPQANISGYSLSNGKSYFNKGFVEHGYLFTVGCIRQTHTYQNGVPRMFMRYKREDVYDPLFAHLPEQPVYTSELFTANTSINNDLKASIFGFNEAWADYRTAQSIVTGQLRSNSSESLDIWHFGDNYISQPYLTSSFTNETSQFVDRTLAVPSGSLDTFLCDFWFKNDVIRVMPTYSVPGLIDHR